MKVLITGAAGFAGEYLANHLSSMATDIEIFGTCYSKPLPDSFKGSSIKLDLGNLADLKSAVKDVMPDEVYHLAGMSFAPEASENPPSAYQLNSIGTCNLLEALAQNVPGCKVLVVSSAEVYGKIGKDENPVSESRPPAPATHYSASKYCAEVIAGQYAKSGKLHVVIARPFNFTGPGQNELFAAPAFASQIARIEAGLQEPSVKTGNLTAVRDFCDVRDVVKAFSLMLERGQTGNIFNVCSGIPVEIKSIYDKLAGMSTFPGTIKHVMDPKRARPSENPLVFGDASALHSLTGWRPAITLDETLADLLDKFRRSIG